MKVSTVPALLILMMTAVLLPCSPAWPGSAREEKAEASMEDVRKETREAIEALKNYSVEQRDEAVADIEAMLQDLDEQIDRLNAEIDRKWDALGDTAREEVREKQGLLRDLRLQLAEWYGAVKHGSAEAWEDVKNGFTSAWQALRKGYRATREEFREN